MQLITGASGFLGRHLVRFLSGQGYKVRALYHSTQPDAAMQQLPGVTWQRCDMLDIYDVEEAMAGITHVYHCAAMVSFSPASREKMLFFNPESTANLVNQALEQGIDKLVHVSSVAALGRSAIANKEITEEQDWEESPHNSAYGISKYMAEMEVWRAMGEGLNAAIINPGIILGASDDWHDGSSQLMQVVYKEFPFYTQGVTAWTDVADVVTIMHRLMESDVENERFIVSAGNYAYRDIFTKMAEAVHKKPPHIKASSWMTGLVWRYSLLKNAITGGNPIITKETARNAQGASYYNNEKLLAALPDFKYTPVDTTIDNMAQSFLMSKIKK